MTEINPDVLAQLHRIHQAVNAGTLDRDTVNDALRLIHDYLTGAAYEEGEGNDGPSGEDEGGEEAAPKRKPRKKR